MKRMIQIPKKIPLFFSREEFNLYFVPHCLDQDEKDIFSAHTGLRLGELINLKWHQVYLIHGIVKVDNQTHISKDRDSRDIPLIVKVSI